MTATVPAEWRLHPITRRGTAEDMGLGDGTGKWSLMVMSDQPIQVMSLMDTPSGHLANLSAGRQEYRGATGLYQVSFEDGMGGDGFIILLPDSRLYAWLPETADERYVARATYSSNSGEINASGLVYLSGDIPLDSNFAVVGDPSDVEFSATYRSGDWITGTYTVAGEQPRAFRGTAFTGFERGGTTEGLEGTWNPVEGESDLPDKFKTAETTGVVDALVPFETEAFGAIECDLSGKLGAINPAYMVYEVGLIQDEEGDDLAVIDCGLLAFGAPGQSPVEMIVAVMDGQTMPGLGNRAVVLLILPTGEQIALGGVFQLAP